MSKIIFWSPLHGQGQTSNLHIVSFIINKVYNKKILLMQTHFSNNNLESPLVGKNVDKEKEDENLLFQDIGLDAAAMFSQMNELKKEILESCCLNVYENFLLMPGTKIKVKETFKRDIGREVIKIIDTANSYNDFVIIDANSGDDELSFSIMDTADLIVINLTQRRYVLEQYFNLYGEKFIDNPKVFYVFGDYDEKSLYNINNFRRKYFKYFKFENTGVIPYCTGYMDAQNEGKIIRFIEKGLKQAEKKREIRLKDDTQYFFQQSQNAVEKMMKLLNSKGRREGIV